MPTPSAIAETHITQASHERFGEFSGDLNPIHADPEAAKAMEPGALLAYGMDMVLWALESLAAAKRLPDSLARIRARFLKWVYLDDCVALSAGQRSQSFELRVDDAPVATLELFSGEREAGLQGELGMVPERLRASRVLALEEMEGREGVAALPEHAEAAAMYPKLARDFGVAAIAELAACSYIIGMEAPGLYSMSMRYDLSFTATDKDDEGVGLQYRVVSVDARFRKAKIEVSGTHIKGTLEAFVRPA